MFHVFNDDAPQDSVCLHKNSEGHCRRATEFSNGADLFSERSSPLSTRTNKIVGGHDVSSAVFPGAHFRLRGRYHTLGDDGGSVRRRSALSSQTTHFFLSKLTRLARVHTLGFGHKVVQVAANTFVEEPESGQMSSVKVHKLPSITKLVTE